MGFSPVAYARARYRSIEGRRRFWQVKSNNKCLSPQDLSYIHRQQVGTGGREKSAKFRCTRKSLKNFSPRRGNSNSCSTPLSGWNTARAREDEWVQWGVPVGAGKNNGERERASVTKRARAFLLLCTCERAFKVPAVGIAHEYNRARASGYVYIHDAHIAAVGKSSGENKSRAVPEIR